MGSEGFILMLSALIGWGLIGLVITSAIKLVGKRETLPGWPILWFAAIGGFITVALYLPAISN